MTVAVLGTGRMGAAMAGTLHRAGHRLVLWNRSPAKAEVIAAATGARVVDSPASAVASAAVAISSLSDNEAVDSVYLGPDGVAAGAQPGSVICEMSTIDPAVIDRIGDAIDRTGAHLLDSPVSGSVATVEQGALTIMVGGSAAALDSARPVLEALSARIVHTGARGSGAATKLAVNALVHGLNVSLSEALVLAESAGVDRKTAYEVFATGAGGAPFVQYKRAAYEDPDNAVVAFSLDLVAKDLELITGLGDRVGAPMEQARVDLAIVRKAIDAGYGDADLSAIAVYLRSKARFESSAARSKG
jgi:3-hydroxyisobutyrate dehydrogenase/2-hydroxy-3-oxopropionate reductase